MSLQKKSLLRRLLVCSHSDTHTPLTEPDGISCLVDHLYATHLSTILASHDTALTESKNEQATSCTTHRSSVLAITATLTEQDRRARLVEGTEEATPRVRLVSVFPQLQAVPQHDVQDQNQHLRNEDRRRRGGGAPGGVYNHNAQGRNEKFGWCLGFCRNALSTTCRIRINTWENAGRGGTTITYNLRINT